MVYYYEYDNKTLYREFEAKGLFFYEYCNMGKMIVLGFMGMCAVIITILGVILGLINRALDRRSKGGR